MWCYTVAFDSTLEGLRVKSEGSAVLGVHVGSTVIPVEPKIAGHIEAVERAIMMRVGGDYNPSPLLGEEGRAELTEDDASNVMEEVLDGWFINHLTFDPEAKLLLYSAPYARERRCLILIETHGVTEYLSNVPSEETLDRGRVVRSFRPLDAAAGVRLIAAETETVPNAVDKTKTLREDSHGLFILEAGASFRLHRAGQDWREALISWNGRSLVFRPFGQRRAQRRAA